MIGGLRKTVSRLAIVAAAGAMTSTSAIAADLGGDCCSDLEERIAELEATTVRKGNRRVSVKLSGALAVNAIWHDSDAQNAIRATGGKISGNTGNDVPSFFKFSGSASITSDLSAGFVMDIDVSDVNSQTNNPANNRVSGAPLTTDDLYLYFDSKRYGRVSIGRVDQAMDGINAISLASITDVQLDEAGIIGTLGTGFFSVGDLDGTDDVGGTVRYDSPTIAGFKLSASYSNDEEDVPVAPDFDQSEIYGVALRYANEFGSMRVGAGIGYENEEDQTDTGTERETLTGSISVMHVPSGVFVNFAAGTEEVEPRQGGPATLDHTGYAIVAGVERKFNSLGKTTFFGNVNFNEDDDEGTDTTNWGLGVVQQIDAAAMTLHAQYNRFECAPTAAEATARDTVGGPACSDDANTFQLGAVIKF